MALIVCGSLAHSLTGRQGASTLFDGVEETNLFGPSVLVPFTAEHSDIEHVFTGSCAAHYFLTRRGGGKPVLLAFGRNEKGQLGLGHVHNVYTPTPVAFFADVPVLAAAAGRAHSLFITQDGALYACGDNKMGQCGVGRASDGGLHKPQRVPGVTDAVAVGAGADFSVVLTKDGSVFAAGSQAFGQCGSGTTGEYIVSAGRSAFKEIASFTRVAGVSNIKSIAVGSNHTVALDSDGLVYTWGAGTYGRCGHGDATDVLLPRLVKQLETPRMRVKYIAAGGSLTYVVTILGDMLYHFGVARKSAEAALYPKPISDLAGWHPRCIACGNTSTLVSAEKSVIAWGPAPTAGELGFGDAAKSSSKPKLIDKLEGCNIVEIAAGYATTLMLMDIGEGTPEGKNGKALLPYLHAYTPPADPAPAPAVAANSAGVAASASAGSKRAASGSAGGEGAATKKKK